MKIKIAEIIASMHEIEVEGMIVSISDIKSVNTRYGIARVAQAVLRDKTGSIILNLWRDQIDLVKTGDKVMIKNAFTRVFNNQLELNVGRDGSIMVLG